MGQNPPVRLRTPDELTPEERAQLEKALDSGITELPPNHVKGFLGEKGPDMRKVEDFAPDLNAGILQENDPGVMWLLVVLAYLLFFPAAYVILWRTRRIPRRTKVIASWVGGIGVMLVAALLLRG